MRWLLVLLCISAFAIDDRGGVPAGTAMNVGGFMYFNPTLVVVEDSASLPTSASFYELTAASAVTATILDGQRIYQTITFTNASENTITISNLGSEVVLGLHDYLVVIWNGTAWDKVLFQDNGGVAPNTLTLVDPDDGRVYQRDIDATTYAMPLAGTYTGSPTAIEARVLAAADDSTVVDWVTVDASPSGGAWSGEITIPQGGKYYVDTRFANDTGVTDTSTSQFYVGMVIAGYGQSNWLNHVNTVYLPAAAAEGTAYYDGSAWTTVPPGNGIREIANGIRTLTGVPVGVVSGGKAGAVINLLLPNAGTGVDDYFGILEQAIIDTGCEYILYNQGEGDAEVNTAQATWIAKLKTIHSGLATAAGRTTAQCPLILASVSVHDIVSTTKDGYWTTFRRTQYKAGEEADIYYSHSNMDMVLVDEFHYDAASYAKSGKRYAQAVAVLNGDETDFAAWFATAATRVDATHTDVTVVHSMGTDFTPTTDITGFEISNDGGATWEVPTAARQDATTIRLTHSDLGTVSRQVRYQPGLNPPRTGIVLDNSELTNPLNFTPDPLTAAGAEATPVWVYIGAVAGIGTAQTQTTSSLDLGGTSSGWLLGIGVAGGGDLTTVTVTPNVGDPVVATLVVDGHSASSPTVSLYQAAIADGATSATVTVAYASNPFATCRVAMWRATAADFASTTATATNSLRQTGVNTIGIDLAVEEGGAMLVMCSQTYSDGTTDLTSAGDLTLAERYDVSFSGFQQAVYDISQIAAADATSTITINSTDTANMRVVAAHWR